MFDLAFGGLLALGFACSSDLLSDHPGLLVFILVLLMLSLFMLVLFLVRLFVVVACDCLV